MTHQKDDMDTEELAAEVKRLAEEVAIECVESARAGKYGKADSRKSLYAAIDRLAALASKPDAAPARTGWPAGMLQDDSPELSKALAGKPDARLHAREAAAALSPLAEAFTPVEQRLRRRVLVKHGGTGEPWRDHWNLIESDSELHAEAAAEIERLRAATDAWRPELSMSMFASREDYEKAVPDAAPAGGAVQALRELVEAIDRKLDRTSEIDAELDRAEAVLDALAAAPVVPPDSVGASPCGGPGSAASRPEPQSVSALRAPIPGATPSEGGRDL